MNNKTLRLSPSQLRPQQSHKATGAGRHVRSIAAVFRAVELVLFLAVLSRCSLMLPIAALTHSGHYFRDVAVAAFSPRFVFVVGNAIVVILFFKSGGRLSPPESDAGAGAPSLPAPETPPTTYIVSVYSSSSAAKSTVAGGNPPATKAAEVKINCYRRSKSEKVMQVKAAAAPGLRRTKTERGVEKTGARHNFPEDRMSSEEFRRKIENFIARQQRCLREEEEDESGALAVAG